MWALPGGSIGPRATMPRSGLFVILGLAVLLAVWLYTIGRYMAQYPERDHGTLDELFDGRDASGPVVRDSRGKEQS